MFCTGEWGGRESLICELLEREGGDHDIKVFVASQNMLQLYNEKPVRARCWCGVGRLLRRLHR